MSKLARARLHLVEQPRVLYRDHRLVGEGGGKLDLFISERTNVSALQIDHTDRRSLPEQWHPQQRTNSPELRCRGHSIFWVDHHVGDMYRCAFKYDAASSRTAARWNWVTFHVFFVVGRETVDRKSVV